MKIFYDNILSDYIYPVSKREVIKFNKNIPISILKKIKSVKFACNMRTTQEGSLVQRGNLFDIRVNFCLKNSRSILLSTKKKYIKQIERFGGIINIKEKYISWKLEDAKKYVLFIFLHEIGHIIYCDKNMNGQLTLKGNSSEERWCDDFAEKNIQHEEWGSNLE